MPYLCTTDDDCPNHWEDPVHGLIDHPSYCHEYGQCRRYFTDALVTNNYVARSTNQGIGGCYLYAKYHVFQTRNAYLVDTLSGSSASSINWPKWKNDRALRLSLAPHTQCAPGATAENFFTKVGLPEYCIERYRDLVAEDDDDYDDKYDYDYSVFPPKPEVCGLCERYLQPYLGENDWPDDCTDFQYNQENTVIYRAGEHEKGECSGSALERKHCLAQKLVEHGPLAVTVLWKIEDVGQVSDYLPFHEIQPVNEIREITCNLDEPGTGTNHVVALVGFNFVQHGESYFYIQNSHGSNRVIYRINFDDKWDTHCLFGRKYEYFDGVHMPVAYDDTGVTPAYQNYCEGDDMDLDGVPDSEDIDIDGNSVVNDWDIHPYNYWLGTDLDQDGHPDSQYRDSDVRIRMGAMCEPACHSQYLRDNAIFDMETCLRMCRDIDGCMTLKIKNAGEDPTDPESPCYWACARTTGPVKCELEEGCCEGEEVKQNQEACREKYHNIANHDATGDGIADVCSYWPVASDIQYEGFNPKFILIQPETPYPFDVWLLNRSCKITDLTISFWLFGGTVWDHGTNTEPHKQSENNVITDRFDWWTRSDMGVCGCHGSDWSYCNRNDVCPEEREHDLVYQSWLWNPIESPACRDYQVAGNPVTEDSCMDRFIVFSQHEVCDNLDCSYHELTWRWKDHQNYEDGNIIDMQNMLAKFKVGWRSLHQPDFRENTLLVSKDPVQMPDSAITDCKPIELKMEKNIHIQDYYKLPRDFGLGPFSALGLMHAAEGGDIYLLGFRRNLDGPVFAKKLSFPADPSSPITSRTYSTTLAHLHPLSWGGSGPGEPVMFLLEVNTEVDGPVSRLENTLWVGLLSRPDVPFYRASDLFGSNGTFLPSMADPKLSYDPVRGRLLVAGGGEENRAAIWAFHPKFGEWQQVTNDLPPNLTGFSFTLNPLTNKVLILGGDTAAAAPKVRLLRLDRGVIQEAPLPAPPEMARVNHGAAMDVARRKLYVYGGRTGDTTLGDLWELNLDNWQWQPRYQITDPEGPLPREKAAIVLEPRFGRIHIIGGEKEGVSLAGEAWTFSNSMNEWHPAHIVAERDESGGSDGVSWGESAVFEFTTDPAFPYPGRVTAVTLESDEPCLSVSVYDFYGELLSKTGSCRTGNRVIGFKAQPEEIYYIEVNPIHGFDKSKRAAFQVRTTEGAMETTGEWPFLLRPAALETASGGTVGLVLVGKKLRVYDLVDPDSPFEISSQHLPGIPRDLAVSGGSALVAAMGPGHDLTAVDIRLPASPDITGGTSFTGPGRRIASWGGYAYAAGINRVHRIRLVGGAGPEVMDTIHTGGPVTAIAAHAGRLLVGTRNSLLLYDVSGETPEFLSEANTVEAVSAIVVHGDTVHAAQTKYPKWMQCFSGASCFREGTGEVFLIQSGDTLTKAGEYRADYASLPYLKWSGDHAFALKNKKVMGMRVIAVE